MLNEVEWGEFKLGDLFEINPTKYYRLSNEEIISVNIPTGIPLVYEFDDNFKVTNKYYLGNQDEINAKINSVANQAKKK